jgi:hypothetical protein
MFLGSRKIRERRIVTENALVKQIVDDDPVG